MKQKKNSTVTCEGDGSFIRSRAVMYRMEENEAKENVAPPTGLLERTLRSTNKKTLLFSVPLLGP